ncbi:hypothetical protein PLEOSDRAFT_163905 [Pleurotus ostreatus PC15]|uniref:Uncharacterized protein n=1 Tax=Pleurotus ostreatus (strain PC15) TaxID=1137138 RepID=A0A067P1M8_PLEO1|nr:hypothetical protein PLEOSDRAFT_163905 [Pleurotus ostreatus PC15]
MSMASAGFSLASNGAHHQPHSSRFPLPRLSLFSHPPQTHTHTRRERGGRASDADSESEESGSETPKPLPKKHKHADAKSVEKPAGVESARRADAVGNADEGLDAEGFLSGIDLRAQMAAWERLKSRGSGRRSGRGDGRGRGRGRGRGAAPGRSRSGAGEGGGAVREGEGHGDAGGGGGGDDEVQAPAPPTMLSPRRKTAKQRTAAARLARQRNLAAKRHDADGVHAEDGYGDGNGCRDVEDVQLLDAEPPPPPQPASHPKPLPRRAEPMKAERPRMPLPRRAVVLGDAVLGGTDVLVARSPARKPLPRVSNFNANSDGRSYKSSRPTSRREDSTADGVDDAASSQEDDDDEEQGEEETQLPPTLKIGPPRGIRRDEGKGTPIPRSTSAGVVNPPAGAGAQAEADSASNPVEATSPPVPPPQTQTTPAQPSRLYAPEGEERSEGLCLSMEVDGDTDRDRHNANDGESQLRSSSPATRTPTESPTDMHMLNPLLNADLSFEVLGGLEATDIYGEDGDDDVDCDLDALNLAYPEEEAPPPHLPLPPATIDIESTISTGAALSLSCNTEILMAFEDPGEEAENSEDWGEGEGDDDLLMYLAYPDEGTPSASADTTNLRNSPSRPPPSPSASTPGRASASPAKRKRKRNGWVKRKRGAGQRGQSARAPPAPVSATENMTYEEWCRSVLASVTSSRRRCGGSHVSTVRADPVGPVSTSGAGGIGNSKEAEDVGRSGRDWEGKGKEAAGEGVAGVEAPPSDDRKKPSEPLKIRIKIPPSLSLKSLLPPLPSPRPNVDSPSPSTASTPVVAADVPSSPVLVPAITSTALPPSKSSETEVAAGSPSSSTPLPIHIHLPTPTSTPAPPPSPIPSYAPRTPITAKRLPAACAGPRCMNLLATELGYGWKMCEPCRAQARRYQHVRKYGDGGQGRCSRSGSEDAGASGEMGGAVQEEMENGGGDGSVGVGVGVEKKSVRFADDDEVFVIEPRAGRHDATAATESYSNSSRQFTPHLEPSRAMTRFQTVEKLLERLDEQMKAFLCARNMWVEWRMGMKEGRWASADAGSGVTVEEQRESPTSREGSGVRAQEIDNGVAELVTDAKEVETPGADNGGNANDGLDASRCYASIQTMDVEPPATRICEDMQRDGELNHLDKPLLRIPSPPNDPPRLNAVDGPCEDIPPSMRKPLSPSLSPLLVPPGPARPAVLTRTPSPAVQCPNPPHTYTLASAFTFDGAFSIVAPFCDANAKHGLTTAGVCARIWGVKEMVESTVGIKFEDRTTRTIAAAKGGNGGENGDGDGDGDGDHGSSLMVCDCGCGQSAVTMKFRWQSTDDDDCVNATWVAPVGVIPTYASTSASWPKPDEISPRSAADSARNSGTKSPIVPPPNANPRPACVDTTHRDTPPKPNPNPNQHPLAHCPPKRTSNISTRVLRVVLTVTVLDDASHPYFPGQQGCDGAECDGADFGMGTCRMGTCRMGTGDGDGEEKRSAAFFWGGRRSGDAERRTPKPNTSGLLVAVLTLAIARLYASNTGRVSKSSRVEVMRVRPQQG